LTLYNGHFCIKEVQKVAWRETTVMKEKLAFIHCVLDQELSFSQVCKNFGISRQTGYKTLKLFQEEGEKGLQPKSRAPLTCSHKTSPAMEEKIINLRIKHPTWGARKIHKNLDASPFAKPGLTTITGILKRNGYIKIEESLKRQKLIRFEREYANDLWQMDFKGKFLLENKEWCFPLTIIDDYSRFSLCLKSCANERGNTVFQHIRKIFEEYGLPNQINVDNGNPWGNSKLFQHTHFTVWLMRLGIKVTHSRAGHPQTNGKIERFHRTLKEDVIHLNQFQNHQHAQELFDHWRAIYNFERPHEAIGLLKPSQRYQPSKHAMPSAIPKIEYEDGAIIKTVRGNGGVAYNGKDFWVGRAFRGLPVKINHNEDNRIVEIYFNKCKIYTGTLV
jgi:transposase InsO family protein